MHKAFNIVVTVLIVQPFHVYIPSANSLKLISGLNSLTQASRLNNQLVVKTLSTDLLQ